MIPEEIKKKIIEEGNKWFGVPDPIYSDLFRQGGEYGYSLAQEEIERLRGLLKSAVYAGWYNAIEHGYRHDFTWEQFKQQNNL